MLGFGQDDEDDQSKCPVPVNAEGATKAKRRASDPAVTAKAADQPGTRRRSKKEKEVSSDAAKLAGGDDDQSDDQDDKSALDVLIQDCVTAGLYRFAAQKFPQMKNRLLICYVNGAIESKITQLKIDWGTGKIEDSGFEFLPPDQDDAGSQKTKNKPSADKKEAVMREIFDRADQDGSGTVSKEELINLFQKDSELMAFFYLRQQGDDEFKKMQDDLFNTMDSDGGGAISWSEFNDFAGCCDWSSAAGTRKPKKTAAKKTHGELYVSTRKRYDQLMKLREVVSHTKVKLIEVGNEDEAKDWEANMKNPEAPRTPRG
eukprot:gnl/MRDRNA2_/MRDRNA2_80457_c0_seq1.p1 gnl/MRDRNA2_/MRDRNA2_80457_c0~~gnl/MRDRNA2_/MRDRNA2_80457_c0_seq1.p1  ORF type:complete len:316 (+),score=92.35 gnl/MRDRNA2_/MRDRNA2_80457_c0_seq1:493-1440(+)